LFFDRRRSGDGQALFGSCTASLRLVPTFTAIPAASATTAPSATLLLLALAAAGRRRFQCAMQGGFRGRALLLLRTRLLRRALLLLRRPLAPLRAFGARAAFAARLLLRPRLLAALALFLALTRLPPAFATPTSALATPFAGRLAFAPCRGG
jgi:hypothetical protein